ncbi:MAG: 3-hydroxyacyl-CoA dehydrogenase NAD-binding domain-containing protein [Bifidobacteriaceae bacterium]|nr:3-hydroxyacyl-CoA dehydrogenase NAD-binding domain-containing protein [Bifidobacteriaceae bacterium]
MSEAINTSNAIMNDSEESASAAQSAAFQPTAAQPASLASAASQPNVPSAAAAAAAAAASAATAASVHRITVAGAGTMGYSMSEIFARKGYQVTLWNHRWPALDRAKTLIAPEVVDAIEYTTSDHAFEDADLIVESIVEDLDAKLAFFQRVTPLARPSAIIATNTSGLSINTLATAVTGPQRFLGMHWFNPPTLIPLIEIIKNDATDPAVARAIYDLAVAIGKKPAIVEKDVPGFAANRIQLAVVREVCSMVSKGVISPEGADAVMKYGLGFRWACLGPLETMDFGGIDVFEHISEYLMPDLEDSHDVPALLKQHCDAGELGVKTGRGFYDYSGSKALEATAERDRKLQAVHDALYGGEAEEDSTAESDGSEA